MPLAVTHILSVMIFLEILRDHLKGASKFFSKKHTFLAGIAGIMPDMDLHLVTLVEFLGKKVPVAKVDLGHRVIFHNLFIPFGFLIFFLLFYFIIPKFKYLKRPKKLRAIKRSKARFKNFGKVFLVLFIGWTVHLTLDAVFTGRIMPFYPLNDYLIDYDIVGKAEALTGIPKVTILVSMDALLLIFWLWHEEMHHYIKDYF